MFKLFDHIHFNSTVTQDIYKQNLSVDGSEVISITHCDIKDCRRPRDFSGETLQLIFIGSTNIYKGFPMFESILCELYDEGIINWELNVWGSQGESQCPNIKYRGYFASSELSKVFHTDGVLVTPSVCNETFSLITLEALSFGIPTIVSSTVGAKDIVSEYDPWFVFKTKEDLKAKLKELLQNRSRLRNFNNQINTIDWKHSIKDHTQKIIELYKK